MNAKFKTIQREDIINYAKLKGYITEEESVDISKLPQDRIIDFFAKTTNDLIMSYEVPARRIKKDQNIQENNSTEVEMTIWLKDFPSTLTEFKALIALK